ncbi:MAG: hypothetical protein J0L86_09410 [Flavobacteriales bacterium]|nr:hypothetical protein [Flavobacteriales bacterium]
MKNLFILFVTTLLLFSCKKKENAIEEPPKMEMTSSFIPTGCYVFNDTKNVISFEITDNKSEIKGLLAYSFAEKDRNSGNFVGQLNNGILIGTYTFQSEGTESTRQVAFKINGNKLLEGYGEMNADGTTFKDTNSLTFPNDMPLIKTPCSQ